MLLTWVMDGLYFEVNHCFCTLSHSEAHHTRHKLKIWYSVRETDRLVVIGKEYFFAGISWHHLIYAQYGRQSVPLVMEWVLQFKHNILQALVPCHNTEYTVNNKVLIFLARHVRWMVTIARMGGEKHRILVGRPYRKRQHGGLGAYLWRLC